MAIGGAEDKLQDRLILRRFVELAGDDAAQILIIPAASEEPAAKGQFYSHLFQNLGAKTVEVLLLDDRSQAHASELLFTLNHYTGVFMSGGDQTRLTDLYGQTPLVERLRSRVNQGQLIVAGTSAGAAVIGHHMIAGGSSSAPPHPDLVELSLGFGFLPQVIVDQHFHNRNRLSRLMSAIALRPGMMGLGIDEDTCALVDAQGHLEVLGRGAVTILDASETLAQTQVEEQPLSLFNLRLHLLRQGDSYHLPQLKIDDGRRLHSPGLPASGSLH